MYKRQVGIHAEQRNGQRAAHGHSGGARNILGPLVRDGVQDARVALLVDFLVGEAAHAQHAALLFGVMDLSLIHI